MVLLHGFGVDQSMWSKQVKSLAKYFQVITYDLRGFGQSSLPTGPYRHCDDLAALLKYLQIDKAQVVGLSMGGLVALNFAICHPQMTHSVVSAAPIMAGFKGAGSFIAARNEIWGNAKTAGLQQTRNNWLRLPLFKATLKHPTAGPELLTMMENYSGWHWFNRDPETPLEPSTFARLEEINCPIMIIIGGQDMQDFQEIAKATAGQMPQAKLEWISGAGHLLNIEAAEEFNRLIIDFAKVELPAA